MASKVEKENPMR